MAKSLTENYAAFYDAFTKKFFSVDGVLEVTRAQRHEAVAQCLQADMKAALGCMAHARLR